ncbi:MAG: hypothetical protein IJ272_03040 [Clostridia bacterium]|nr:hypothetical protein [Clostridia bacterium]
MTIDNSVLEIIGTSDSSNLNVDASYTLNRIGTLNIQNGTDLYLRRGFNVVGGLNSLAADGSKATVTITDGTVTSSNVDNRIYVYEGVNLFIAKQEYSSKTAISEYGEVTGMTFFGMYTHDRTTGEKKYDVYDPVNPTSNNTFVIDSYVEGKYDTDQAITVDGFYTNAVQADSSIITKYVTVITAEPVYQDWMLGDEKVYTQEVTLVAQRNKERVYQSVPLEYLTQQGAEYEVKLFSVNSLEPDINLVSRTSIPRVASSSDIANTTFALTMKNGSGWQNSGETQFYTSGTPIQGTTIYLSDYSGNAPYIDLYLYNSINITQTKDCGYANIVFEVTKTTNGDASEGTKFKIALSVNIQTIGEIIEGEFQTAAAITEGRNFGLITENEIFITDRSSMTAFFDMYPLGTIADDDYRVLSSTCQLPIGTQLTMVDYGEDEYNPKVYYYEVDELKAEETETGRYVYNFSDFRLISSKEESTSAYYANNNAEYQKSGFEEYKILIDFKNATITEELLEQNIRFELRDSEGYMKNYEILPTQFNIYTEEKRSDLTLNVTKDTANVYDMIETGELKFTVKSIMTTQSVSITSTIVDEEGNETQETVIHPIEDTYYYQKKLGMAISLYDSEGNKVPYEKLRGVYYVVDGQEYYPDLTGTARWYLADNVVTVEKQVKMYIEGGLLESGTYTVRVENFASEDGKYFGAAGDNTDNTIEINMIDLSHGLEVEIQDGDRVIDSETGKTHHGTNEMNISVKASDVVFNTNIRVKLYKRDITYEADASDNLSYADVTYTQVDLANYVSNTLTSSGNTGEYIVSNAVTEQTLINFNLNLKTNLATGGYKLQFNIYSGDNLLGTVERHFVVTNLLEFIDGLTAEEITVEDYGGVVTNYSPKINNEAISSIGWRIFHSDGDNIYLIADEYIEKKYVPTGKNGTAVTQGSSERSFALTSYNDYEGYPDIQNSTIANKWLAQYMTSGYTSTRFNMKATAYLLDVNQWTCFTDSVYAEYAIGAPTIEMFAEAYNKTHEIDIDLQVSGIYGYDIKFAIDESYGEGININASEEPFVIQSEKAGGMWLTAPSADANNYMMNVRNNGLINGTYVGDTIGENLVIGDDWRFTPSSMLEI